MMKNKECSECGTSFTYQSGSPADRIGKCHLCMTGIRTDLYVLRGLIAKSTGIDKHTRVLIEKRINILEGKFMQDFDPRNPPTEIANELGKEYRESDVKEAFNELESSLEDDLELIEELEEEPIEDLEEEDLIKAEKITEELRTKLRAGITKSEIEQIPKELIKLKELLNKMESSMSPEGLCGCPVCRNRRGEISVEEMESEMPPLPDKVKAVFKMLIEKEKAKTGKKSGVLSVSKSELEKIIKNDFKEELKSILGVESQEEEQTGTEQGAESEDYFSTTSTQNKIKHMQVIHNGRKSYACNYAVKPTEKKLTTDSTEVNCSNCLRIMNK